MRLAVGIEYRETIASSSKNVLIQLITCSKLTGPEIGHAMGVSKQWREIFAEDTVWQELCHKDWGLETPCTTDFESAPSFQYGPPITKHYYLRL